MNRIRQFLIALTAFVALCLTGPVAYAQTSLNTTTTSAAVARDTDIVALTSLSNISAKDLLVIDNEAMEVVSLNTASANVKRGVQGTRRQLHSSGAFVYSGAPRRFYLNTPVGPCTATSELYLPHVAITTTTKDVTVTDCKNSLWVRVRESGYRVQDFGRDDGGTAYTANGAITVQPGVSFINGTTLAMTLANPTLEQNGMVMYIISTNASAHTVTYTAGFGGGTTARDVATFGGAINDELVIVAYNQVWWVISTRNVTFG